MDWLSGQCLSCILTIISRQIVRYAYSKDFLQCDMSPQMLLINKYLPNYVIETRDNNIIFLSWLMLPHTRFILSTFLLLNGQTRWSRNDILSDDCDHVLTMTTNITPNSLKINRTLISHACIRNRARSRNMSQISGNNTSWKQHNTWHAYLWPC